LINYFFLLFPPITGIHKVSLEKILKTTIDISCRILRL